MSENSGDLITSQNNDENNTKTSTKKEELSSNKRSINDVTSEDSNSVLDGEDSNSNLAPQRKATPKNAKKLKSSENGEGDKTSKQPVAADANNEAAANDELDDEEDDEEDEDDIVGVDGGDFDDEDDEEGEDGDAADDDDDEDD